MDDQKGETFDDDGYPTEWFLDQIRQWDYTRGHTALMEFALSGHTYPTYWSRSEPKDGKIEWDVSTGGWGGNEDIVKSLLNNIMFCAMCWVQSRRGGHYIFETREGA